MALRYNHPSSVGSISGHYYNTRHHTNGAHGHNYTDPDHWRLKCTDLPQFDACQAQADFFRSDDKLHLRILCGDTARCASLIAIHRSSAGYSDRGGTSAHNTAPHQMILDYSRQRVTGETMEQLYDLGDAVGMAERMRRLRQGAHRNETGHPPVLHHVLRMPAYYALELNIEVTKQPPPAPPPPPSMESYGSSPPMEQPTSPLAQSVPSFDGYTVLKDVHKMRQRIQDICFRIRSGAWLSATSEPLQHVVVVATGGTHLATDCVAHALQSDPTAATAAHGRTLHFVSNADPVDAHTTVRDLDPCKTLVLVCSPTFSARESNNSNPRTNIGSTTGRSSLNSVVGGIGGGATNGVGSGGGSFGGEHGSSPVLLNARTVLDWLVSGIQAAHPVKTWTAADIMDQQVFAVTRDTPMARTACRNFGIPLTNVFAVAPWVNERYSVCSAFGILPLALQYSYPVMAEFLDGAHDMDEHFFDAPLRENIPVILGLLGVWNSTFLGYSSRAILPYSHAMSKFPAWIQHVDMESNGKRVAVDGTPLLHRSGEIDFGDVGGQHSFFQLLHQGRVVPADFIGFMESQQPVDLPGEAVSNHDELMSSFFAQPDALAYGKTLVDLVQEGTYEPLREHMVFSGNRPSSSLLLTRLDAFSMGQLIALYEHRTAIQGFIWGINSFDQFGLDLGSVLGKHVRAQLSASRKTGASVQGFNASTSTLLEYYLANERQQQTEANAAKVKASSSR